MGLMVYSLQWVMQDFVHQQYNPSTLGPRLLLNGSREVALLTSGHGFSANANLVSLLLLCFHRCCKESYKGSVVGFV